jgi:hypothetical protein
MHNFKPIPAGGLTAGPGRTGHNFPVVLDRNPPGIDAEGAYHSIKRGGVAFDRKMPRLAVYLEIYIHGLRVSGDLAPICRKAPPV